MENSRYAPPVMKLMILRFIGSRPEPVNRFNMLGSGYPPGGALEQFLSIGFTDDERALADRCTKELEASGLLRTSFRASMQMRGDWLELSPKGQQAVLSNAIDDLDRRLAAVNPQLVETRAGAWTALYGKGSDSGRHAAQSARELLRQVVDGLAPDKEVARRYGLKRVTQRDRLKFVLERSREKVSESSLDLIDAEASAAGLLFDRLSAVAKAEERVSPAEVERLVVRVEACLKDLLGAE